MTDKPQRDRLFNPNRHPRSTSATQLVTEVVRQVEGYETHHGLRRRRRKPADQAIFEDTVAAVVCDTIHRELTLPGGQVAVPLSKQVLGHRSRYQSLILGNKFPDILRLMAAPEMGWLLMETGKDGHFGTGKRTTIRVADKLLKRIDQHGITLTDLGVNHSDTEVIILRSSLIFEGTSYRDKQTIAYDDTPDTTQYREEVRRINRWLEQADIPVNDDAVSSDDGGIVDPGNRHLKRIFSNGSFEQCGRLFGGFWQRMKSETRHEAITINNEPVATVDYAQMTARMLYGKAGVEPAGDLYAVPVKGERAGIKKVFNAMLYADKSLRRFPKGSRGYFPKSVRCDDVVAAIQHRHPILLSHFFTGVGLGMMFTESQIMVDVLLTLIDHDVVALPIHDAVIVPRSATQLVKAVMVDAFHRHVGTPGVVSVEGR